MNIETVNELIASLESAGELSIKETKVKALAKAYQQLAAENVGMDAFVNEMLTIVWRGCDVDGWTIQDLALKHGLIRQEVYCADEHETLVEDPGNFEDGDDVYFRVETPATDRIYAGIKAEAKSHDLNALISHYSAELDAHIANGGDQFDATSIRLRGFIVGGRMFREKLRDEDKALALREGADKC
ncbi:hypothetical protein [Klebsiella oxytoca]|uniref:hypothetical protein n=1 Tax=Klebsiella oxytoca TaxID=571 RepID=UPI00115749C9|nr:hypothetical protein [Klebsiella oxytoca]